MLTTGSSGRHTAIPPPLSLEGTADQWIHREDTDYYSQPGKLFGLMFESISETCRKDRGAALLF